MTKKLREKISKIAKRQLRNGERIHPWIGRKHSEESKEKISLHYSNSCNGKRLSRKTKNKIGAANKGKSIIKMNNSYLFLSPLKVEIIVDYGLKKFAKETGLSGFAVRKLIQGKKINPQTAKGWEFIKTLKINNTGKLKIYIVTSPAGKKFVIKTGLTTFCKKNNLHRANMIKVSKGLRRRHKGWKCEIKS